MRKICFALALLALICIQEAQAQAWKATGYGPLSFDKINNVLSSVISRDEAKGPTNITILPFGAIQQTIPYPTASGASIADGWDFVVNRRIPSQCITYGAPLSEDYQDTSLTFTRVVDSESLEIALNIDISAKASGTFSGISAGGSSESKFEGLTKTVSKDELIVAHASVVNGASYINANIAGDSKIPSGVRLTDSALALIKGQGNVDAFRTACGDGFVAAIGTGADSYIMYRFSDVTHNQRIHLESNNSANAGISGLFSGGITVNANGTIVSSDDNANLSIFFAQSGGQPDALPIDQDSLKKVISALPVSARQHGKPLYLVVIPYSTLANWPATFTPSIYAAARTTLTRYMQRLQSSYIELQAIVHDFEVSQTSSNISSSYLHDTLLGYRGVAYSQIGDGLLEEIHKIANSISAIDSVCSQNANPPQIQIGPPRQVPSCSSVIAREYTTYNSIELTDYNYLIKMPIPKSAIDPNALSIITNAGDDGRYLLSIAIYRHWVERLSKQRCDLLGECMKTAERKAVFSNIRSSLGMN